MLSATFILLWPLALDNCGFSCRFRCSARVPHYMLPTSVLPCTAGGSKCDVRARNATAVTAAAAAAGTRPRLFVAVTTIPPRAGLSLQHAVDSFWRQRRQPDKVIVTAAAKYHRFGGAGVDLSKLREQSGLERISTCEDQGPGTKLLCALPRLRQLESGGDGHAFAVLLDDDLTYRKWALAGLEAAILDDSDGERQAYSYDVYTLTEGGKAVTGGLWPGLLAGAGHALFAMRVSLLHGVEDFFKCVHRLEPRSFYHDDVVISMFLQDVRGVQIYRLGGTPWEHASKTFPDVHDTTVSFLSPGALIKLGQAEATAGGNSSATSGRRGRHRHPKASPPPPPQAAAAAGGAAQPAEDEAASMLSLKGAGEAAKAMLANGTSVSETRKALFSRLSLNVAIATARRRMLQEGLCGVTRNSSSCVGKWCEASEWGIGGPLSAEQRASATGATSSHTSGRSNTGSGTKTKASSSLAKLSARSKRDRG